MHLTTYYLKPQLAIVTDKAKEARCFMVSPTSSLYRMLFYYATYPVSFFLRKNKSRGDRLWDLVFITFSPFCGLGKAPW
jgi:hypothetical protein